MLHRISKNNPFEIEFPEFASFIRNTKDARPEEILPPMSGPEIVQLEQLLGVALPPNYRRFLRCSRGLWLFGGAVQMSSGHPFFHNFPPYESLTLPQRHVVEHRGGNWPPPSEGMLCFAEFFMEADGDQVLFDVHSTPKDGEFPIVYYAHEVPSVRVIASSFEEWLEGLPKLHMHH